MLETLLNSLAKELQIPLAKRDDRTGLFEWQLGEWRLVFRESGQERSVEVEIGSVGESHLEDLLMYIMKANFLGQGCGNCVLGMSADEKYLTLSLIIPYEMNVYSFKDAIEEFVNYAFFWKRKLTELKEKPSLLR